MVSVIRYSDLRAVSFPLLPSSVISFYFLCTTSSSHFPLLISPKGMSFPEEGSLKSSPPTCWNRVALNSFSSLFLYHKTFLLWQKAPLPVVFLGQYT